MEARTLQIAGMTCDHCAHSLERALGALPGIEAEVSYPTGTARVQVAEGRQWPLVADTVRHAGYHVVPALPVAETPAPGREGAGLAVVILGGGSAAFAAALRATEHGARVTIVERGTMGGTCVNVGCVPSKILIRAAQAFYDSGHPHFAGVAACVPRLVPGLLASERQERVDALRAAKYQAVIEDNPDIVYLQGEAHFVDAHTVDVRTATDVTRLRADRYLIATGASPAVPPIEGLAGTPYWTSTEALVATEVPPDMIVLGASAVALELAQAWARLGTHVTLLARHGLLSREDSMLGLELASLLRAEGMDVRTDVTLKEISWKDQIFSVDVGGVTLKAARLLVATGRSPNTRSLELAAAGVVTDARGFVAVDSKLRTSAEHIYAAGDCTTLPQFVYVAAAAGTRAAMNMVGVPAELNLAILPAVVFTDPQVATVGLTEQEAHDHGLDAEQRTLRMDQVPRALANFDTRGFIKLVAERGTGRLLGAHILAPEAGEMIQTISLALRGGMQVSDLADSLFPYLTLVEGLKLCAQTFTRDVRQLSCCAG